MNNIQMGFAMDINDSDPSESVWFLGIFMGLYSHFLIQEMSCSSSMKGFPGGSVSVKESLPGAGRLEFNPWVSKISEIKQLTY